MTQARETLYLSKMRRIKLLQRLFHILCIGGWFFNKIQLLFGKELRRKVRLNKTIPIKGNTLRTLRDHAQGEWDSPLFKSF